MPAATDVSTVFLATARELLDALDCARGVRLLGVSLSQLEAGADAQGVLALDDDESQRRRAGRAPGRGRARGRRGARSLRLAVGRARRRSCRNRTTGKARHDADRARRVRSHRHRARVRAPAARRTRSSIDAALTATYDADPEAGREGRAAPRRRARRVGRRARRRRRRRVGVHLDGGAPRSGRARGRRRAARCSARSRSARISRRPSGSPALLERVPHQVGLVLRWSPVFQTGGRDHRERRVRPPAGDDPARRPVLPDPGLLRIDVAQGRRARRRRHAHRALDPRHRRVALAARRSRCR